MARGSRQTILAGVAALLAGVGLAFAVAGAAAGPSQRSATIYDEDGTLKFGSGDQPDIITISGRQTKCCITIDGSTTISDLSKKCEQEGGGFQQVVCNARSFRRVDVSTGNESDDVTVAGRFNALTIRGEPGNDKILGGRGGEKLLGGDDNDLIKGRGGKDRINGGPGGDQCQGSKEATIKECEVR